MNTTKHSLPAIDWPTLLRRAPFFSAAIIDALCEEMPLGLAPPVRAVYDFDLFDAQASNGGVDQYFRNVLLERGGDPGRVLASIAHNPALADALPFVDEVHAIWHAIAPAYAAAAEREDEDGDDDEDAAPSCDAILAPYAERVEAWQQRFFAAHHAIRQALEADVVRAFSIEAVRGLRGYGIEHVVLDDGAYRLRFNDGFPVGPNTLENEDGSCDVVWFSRDRTLLQAETPERVHALCGAALGRNRDEWMLRMRRMGSRPCKQPGRLTARFRPNPSGKCLAGRSGGAAEPGRRHAPVARRHAGRRLPARPRGAHGQPPGRQRCARD